MFNLFGTSFLFITCHLTGTVQPYVCYMCSYSHFVAHQQKVEERNSDYKRISSYFSLPETSDDKGLLKLSKIVHYSYRYDLSDCFIRVVFYKILFSTDNYDYVFWLGDLNYRVDLSREECNQLLMKSNILVSWPVHFYGLCLGVNVMSFTLRFENNLYSHVFTTVYWVFLND